MKLRKNTAFAVALVASLAALSGFASAQSSRFYTNAGSGSTAFAGGPPVAGNLDSIGYDSSTFVSSTGATLADTGTISARPSSPGGPAYYQNYIAAGLPTTNGADVLSSVTVYLYAESVNPDGSSLSFTLYDGLNGLGNPTALVLSSANENNFFAITLSAAQFTAGFSITATGLGNQGLLNVSTEENATAFQNPGLLANYVQQIPEPSAALLGALGSLVLIRRRRA